MRTEIVYWLAAGWVLGIAVMLIAMVLALWQPVVGLGILGVTVALGPLSARLSRKRVPLSGLEEPEPGEG